MYKLCVTCKASISAIAKNGISNVTLPNSANAGNFEIIALLQNTITGEISAATKAALPVAAI